MKSSATFLTVLFVVSLCVGSCGGSVSATTSISNHGSLDASFGSGGILSTTILNNHSSASFALAIQNDGKIVAAGSSYNGSYNVFALARYNPDGSLDTSFGAADGKVTTAFGAMNAYARSVAIQSDGKIVAAGYISNNVNSFIALARYFPNGNPDTSFGTGGTVITPAPGGGTYAYGRAVALQYDGKIVVAGYADNNSYSAFAIVRYSEKGDMDTTFNASGMVITSVGNNHASAYAIAIQNDGKIVVVGDAYAENRPSFALVRYNSNGSLDELFGIGGKVSTPVGSNDSSAYAVTTQRDGKIVLTGYSWNRDGYTVFSLARYNQTGALDGSFGLDGVMTTQVVANAHSNANAVAIQDDGKIVAAGNSQKGHMTPTAFALARYDQNGSLDTSFSSDGKLITECGFGSTVQAVAIQRDGKIVAAGWSDDNFTLARYWP